MARDFLDFFVKKSGAYLFAPGTNELMNVGTGWKSKAESALGRAIKACEHEAANLPYSAGEEWQKIFGTDIPKGV